MDSEISRGLLKDTYQIFWKRSYNHLHQFLKGGERMLDKTVENYIAKLRTRMIFLKKDQLGNDMYNQIMVKKEVSVLEYIIDDLQELESIKAYRCFSYWTC